MIRRMNTLPVSPSEITQQAVDLLQENYATHDHPYSLRGVLPLITELYTDPEALQDFVTPLTTPNKLTCWLQLADNPSLQEAVANTLPDKIQNTYYGNLFNHATNGDPLEATHEWIRNPFSTPTWEQYTTEHKREVQEANSAVTEVFPPIGPHGNHRQYEHDILAAGIWMVCQQKSSTRNWPVATHPERTPDALHFLSYGEPHTYSRGALSIAGALSRIPDERHWRQTYETGMTHLAGTYDDDGFRLLMQPAQLDFAMMHGAYETAVSTEREVFPLRSQELTQRSIAALCSIIRLNP